MGLSCKLVPGGNANAHPCIAAQVRQAGSSELVACAPTLPLTAAACASRRLNGLASEQLWGALAVARLGQRLVDLLEASPTPPEWWAGRSWRQRLAALAAGASFQAQVFNRELGAAGLHCIASRSATASLPTASSSVAAAVQQQEQQAGARKLHLARTSCCTLLPTVLACRE